MKKCLIEEVSREEAQNVKSRQRSWSKLLSLLQPLENALKSSRVETKRKFIVMFNTMYVTGSLISCALQAFSIKLKQFSLFAYSGILTLRKFQINNWKYSIRKLCHPLLTRGRKVKHQESKAS